MRRGVAECFHRMVPLKQRPTARVFFLELDLNCHALTFCSGQPLIYKGETYNLRSRQTSRRNSEEYFKRALIPYKQYCLELFRPLLQRIRKSRILNGDRL